MLQMDHIRLKVTLSECQMLGKSLVDLVNGQYLKTEIIHRIRKLLTSAPSTPVTNDASIPYGKLIAFGFSTVMIEAGGFGASKDI